MDLLDIPVEEALEKFDDSYSSFKISRAGKFNDDEVENE
jgi:hypothetical protein